MAMWLLYSKDKSSFRIRTTKEKLEKHANKFMEYNYWTKHINSTAGTIQSSSIKAKIENVEYVNFNDILTEIKTYIKKKEEK